MKSKKLVALALTAAMAISMVSMTAFAKTTYSPEDDKEIPNEVTAKVVLTEKEAKDLGVVFGEKTYKVADADTVNSALSVTDGTIPANKYGNENALEADKEVTADDFSGLQAAIDAGVVIEVPGDASIEFGKLKVKTYDNTPTKTFWGWKTGTYQDESTCDWGTDKDPKSKTFGETDKVALTKDTDADGDTIYVAEFATVGRIDTKDDAIKANIAAIDAAKGNAADAASREAHLAEEDAKHAATNNVDTKSSDGVVTKKAPVGTPSETPDHDLQVAGIGDIAKKIAWTYAVNETDKITLLDGKNARVTLPLPDGYTTDGYKVTVYHIKGWCSAEKVKGLDIGKTDVTFWANDFSPYVLLLTPKDVVDGTSTGNPSTGDFSAVPVALLAAAALSATGFVAYKKRKAE